MDLGYLFSAIIGGLAPVAFFLVKIRGMQLELRQKTEEIDNKKETSDLKLEGDTKINHEQEWKRMIDLRDLDITRLRDRDEQQDRAIDSMRKDYELKILTNFNNAEEKFEKLRIEHLECMKNEVRNDERRKLAEEKQKLADEAIRLNTDKIKLLEDKLALVLTDKTTMTVK